MPVKVQVSTASAAVIEGVPPGTRVVVEGAQNLRAGSMVREATPAAKAGADANANAKH